MDDHERTVTFEGVPQGDDEFCFPCPFQVGGDRSARCNFYGRVLAVEDGYAKKCEECLEAFPITDRRAGK